MIYFNEIDAGLGADLSVRWPGSHVDTRSIRDVQAREIPRGGRAHFFAGIGGWEYALGLAGWPSGISVWTGSCPCQPFSVAGKRKGASDDRHLWPEWFRLIRECRPPILFGEQVGGADGLAWLDLVHDDLEGCGYTVGAALLPAAGVGAPHGRHRIFFGAHNDQAGCVRLETPRLRLRESGHDADGCGDALGGADAECDAAEPWRVAGKPRCGDEANGKRAHGEPRRRGCPLGGIDTGLARLEGHAGHVRGWRGPGWLNPLTARSVAESGATRGFWADCDWWWGCDGKWRPAGPGVQPLAHGLPARVRRRMLSGYGNAIVPQVAAEFVIAFTEAMDDTTKGAE